LEAAGAPGDVVTAVAAKLATIEIDKVLASEIRVALESLSNDLERHADTGESDA
jgi:hypothetical protein